MPDEERIPEDAFSEANEKSDLENFFAGIFLEANEKFDLENFFAEIGYQKKGFSAERAKAYLRGVILRLTYKEIAAKANEFKQDKPNENRKTTANAVTNCLNQHFAEGIRNFFSIKEDEKIDWLRLDLLLEDPEVGFPRNNTRQKETIGGRYEIIELLNNGDFCKTYKARDNYITNKPFCVVKKLKNPDSQRGLESFNREAKVLLDLGKHERIPGLLAFFPQGQEFYLVQEYIEGHALIEELVPGSQWSEQEVISLLREILEILNYVHQKNVIHRHIHPNNLIRRDKDRKIALIDFGKVKQISAQLVNCQDAETSTICTGKNGYAPTEQLNKRNPQLCSDIYAVGILGIQALTGIDPKELTINKQTQEVIWRDSTQVSDPFAKILEKMVYDDFNKRYESAAKALEAFESLPTS